MSTSSTPEYTGALSTWTPCPYCGDTITGTGYHHCRGAVRIDYGQMYLALGTRIADLLDRLVTTLEQKGAS